MAIIKQYHKDTDTTYVYESTSYWDPEKKQSRSKRRCIGKIDPETGEMVPTGKKGRKAKETEDMSDSLKELELLRKQLAETRIIINNLNSQIAGLSAEKSSLQRELQKLRTAVAKANSLLESTLS